MSFDDDYERFLKFHLRRRSGDRLRRLQEGHKHAEREFLEQVWWPAFGHFDGLHPEYEVRDYQDGYRYIDFAYVNDFYRIAIEIDGLGTHARNITQWQYSQHMHRQNQLLIDGWRLLRFTYQTVHEQPRVCQQTIQQQLGRLMGLLHTSLETLPLVDREIVRLTVLSIRPITPAQIATKLQLCDETVKRHLKRLTDGRWLMPARGNVRVRSYCLHPSRRNLQL